jgi:hypothetical protein
MKKILILFLLFSFFACKEKKEAIQKPDINLAQYKSIMRDMILAQKVKEVIVSQDSLQVDPIAVVYKQYNIDSISLKKATDYYSRDPKIFVEIYSSIKNEFIKKLDSLEQNKDTVSKKIIKSDSITLKKKSVEKLIRQNNKAIRNIPAQKE